jgi:hypothetical protein
VRIEAVERRLGLACGDCWHFGFLSRVVRQACSRSPHPRSSACTTCLPRGFPTHASCGIPRAHTSATVTP